MKITIRYGEQLFIVDVSENIYLALDENRRKAENLYHEKRRHWDAHAFDESIIAKESHHHSIYMETPEETYFRKEKFKAVYETLATCTPHTARAFFIVRFGRFELCGDRPPAGLLQVCRKRFSGSRSTKNTETFDGLPPRKPTFWLLSEGL